MPPAATCGEVDREWFQARYNSGGSSSSKKEVVNVAAAVAVPLVLIIAAGSGSMADMVHGRRQGSAALLQGHQFERGRGDERAERPSRARGRQGVRALETT